MFPADRAREISKDHLPMHVILALFSNLNQEVQCF